ncbi:hypothetical protein [Methylacidiphilum kamchatkense]|uniref:hypothetical protein n=1 Tax=Methylacidiphilum kamchatkense TaxID=431057 RepID=UPI000A5DE19E|nr:hypothetical protein [Methylacidiphilum kamchatkense]
MLKEITKGTKSNSLSLDHRPFYRIIAFGVIAAGFFFICGFPQHFGSSQMKPTIGYGRNIHPFPMPLRDLSLPGV